MKVGAVKALCIDLFLDLSCLSGMPPTVTAVRDLFPLDQILVVIGASNLAYLLG